MRPLGLARACGAASSRAAQTHTRTAPSRVTGAGVRGAVRTAQDGTRRALARLAASTIDTDGILADVCDTVAATLGVARDTVTAYTTWAELGADSLAVLNILLTLEAKFDLTFDDEAAAARASSPGACADLLAGGVARADARAAAGPLAGADDVEALVAASSFFQFSSEMAASRGEPLGPTVKIKTGRGWEMEGDELEGG